MKPGRELDALVAEKVMGWTTRGFSSDGWTGTEWLEPTSVPGICVKRYLPPEYSTDIAAAWEVVEKLAELGTIIEVVGQPWGFKIRFYQSNPETQTLDLIEGAMAQGKDAPHAICLAALKACGHPLNEAVGPAP